MAIIAEQHKLNGTLAWGLNGLIHRGGLNDVQFFQFMLAFINTMLVAMLT